MTVRNMDVFNSMEAWAPKWLAYDWDNVGLQIGSYQTSVNKVMVTLDVLESTVDEAIANNVNLIIAHHPLLFKPLKQLDTDSPKGRVIRKLIAWDISVYAAHTNLDMANGGVNDMLCDRIGIYHRDILSVNYTEKMIKMVVFVPESHADEVREAMSEQGAGHIGDYSHCTFQSAGQGTFKPLEGTDPYIGSQDTLAFVDEVKMETIIPQYKLSSVVDAMMAAHPYEEAAYDLYPVENSGPSYGLGRIGVMDESMSLNELSDRIKKTLNISRVRVTGDLSATVKRIAVLGGSGEKYLHEAKKAGADVYITGDMTLHPAQDAQEMGLSMIDPGHYAEKVMKDDTKAYLDKEFSKDVLNVIVSQANTDPFQIV
ncbi:Nif3-like dinuclear metal center hexameric protein [Lentibacillus halophilus]|uniref:GTP cyclohydrolase 1 type 2 homolog n=1 Tax=Lentibacillus halophilus TaxID=295065 RepID=A0ABN0ZD27_9BACI